MKYARLGDSGLIVSRLGFGVMTFGEGDMLPGVRNSIGQASANNMVAQALDAGVNLFDTADLYRGGETEIMLGRALGERRRQAVIATKLGFRMSAEVTDVGLSARRIAASIDASLKRLGTDYIDLYQLHIPDPVTPLEETLRALEDARRSGKVRYAGLSNFPAWQSARAHALQQARGYAPVVSLQMYYSLLCRDIEREIVPFAASAGLGVIVWSPLASGFLTGKYTGSGSAPGRRDNLNFPPVDVELGSKVVDVLKEIAAQKNAVPAQIALAWVLSRATVSSVLVGARTPEQFIVNLGAADIVLAPEELRRLNELTEPAPAYPQYMIAAMSEDRTLAAALEA